MENYEKAERDYISGMKYKEIAKKYGVSINTVKSWKQRYDWNRNKKGMHTKTEKVCTQNQKSKAAAVEQTDDGTKETLQNTELTIEKQMFCLYYIRTFNATQSYQKAYGCTYDSAKAHGYELLQNVAVLEEIKRLKELKRKQIIMGEEDIVELQMRIAFGDVGNYVLFGQEKVPVMSKNGPVKIKNRETGEEEMMTHEIDVIHFNESNLVDTQIIQEIKQGKDGVSIKLADKQKAIEWLSRYFQMHPQDKQRQEFDKRKLELELLKIELQTKEREEDTPEHDNFLEVLNSSAQEVWKDERLE